MSVKAQQSDFKGVTKNMVLIISLIEGRDLAVRTFNRDEGKKEANQIFTQSGEFRDNIKKNILNYIVEQ